MNKRGGIGGFISMFVAIVVIAIILLVFVMMNGVWKKFVEEPAAMNYFGESGREKSFLDYMDNGSRSINQVRFDVASNKNVDIVVLEVFPEGVGGK